MLNEMLGIEIPWTLILFAILISAATADVLTMKIPNIITIPAIFLGLMSVKDYADLIFKIIAIVVIAIIGYTRIMGMGDLKLWMATATFIGLLDSIYAIGIASALFIIILLLFDYKATIKTMRIFKNQILYQQKIKKFDQKAYPFGPFMALGVIIMVIWRIYV